MKHLILFHCPRLIAILLIVGSTSQHLQAQNAKAALQIDGTGYSVEVTQDNRVYKVKLSLSADSSITENTNYFTLNTFRDIVFSVHRRNLIKASPNVESTTIVITDSVKNKAEPSISSAFLQLITELYNIEVSGQKIGKITLNEVVPIKNLYQSLLDNNEDRTVRVFQRAKTKWSERLYSKEKREVLRKIRRCEKRDIRKGLDSAKLVTLNELKVKLEKLKEASKKLSDANSGKKDSVENKNSLKVEYARIVFEDGTIKQITVKGTHNGQTKIFSNQFAIGITTRRNIEAFDGINLYQETYVAPKSQSITLSDVVDYERLVDLRTNDFSPADVTIDLQPKETQELFKASSTQLFTLNVFSDLVGFNNNNPNGLVQLEFSKRINLWTKRRDNSLMRGTGIGYFTYMTPNFELAKIEENNRSIKVNQHTNSTGLTVNYLSPLEIHRFSFARTSNEVNMIDLQGPSLSLHLNTAIGVAVTQLQDTIPDNSSELILDEHINSLMLGAQLRAIFNPESKWAFELSSRWTYIDPLIGSSALKLRSVEKEMLRGPNYLINSWEFLLTWNTGNTNSGSSNKLFGRFRFNHEWDYWNNNYSEFQIGYSIFLKSSQLRKK